MRKYEVFFECFGKKMKTFVMAESEQKAVESVKNSITIHKAVKANDEFNAAIDLLDGIMDAIKK